ncbi:hypothetical protein M0R72_00205 [Candidatus Pacearchaeota archaeon]|jgi:hypothetical protein|nr:hypothetical protein [Candidatus Pacearchaeota archaeon]
MNKPQVFTLLDFVTFGMLAVIAIVADVATWMSDTQFQAKALMTTVCVAFAAIYAVVLFMRKKTIDSCDFITDGGWGVRNHSTTHITKEEIEVEIQRAKDLWAPVIHWDDAVDAVLKKNYMIVFEDGVGTDPCTGKRIAGITIASRFSAFDGQIIVYKMDTLTLKASALIHEIGHLIYFGKFGILDNEITHKYMADHMLS